MQSLLKAGVHYLSAILMQDGDCASRVLALPIKKQWANDP
jgi:hypothetical protein